MPSAVIFDVDGTLVDSVGIHAQSWQDAFQEIGHEIAFEDLRRQIGKGGDELMPVFMSEDEIRAKGEALHERRGKILKERHLQKIVAFPDVRRLFEKILKEGKRIALASSAKGDELQHYKQLAKIDDLLDAETSSDDADRSKPHPDIFQAALAKLNNPAPEHVIVVGDTPYDAEAAAKAGMRTIGLMCGGWSEDELKQAGCIACYKDPSDLLAQFQSSPLAD